MSFTWFRKHEKTFLWITVGFTIVIFALFSSMSDVDRALSGEPKAESIAGTFMVATTGETREVQQQELLATRRSYSRLAKMMSGRSAEITEDDVWSFLITVADAQDSGLVISDRELATALAQIAGGDKALYEQFVLGSGFPTLLSFEEFFRQMLLTQRWREAQMMTASVLPAEDVYQRWRVDHELFDLDVVSFPDREADAIPSPGDEALRAWFDELPEFRRDSLFVEPARHDIAFGYLMYDVDADAVMAGLDEEVAAKISEPTDDELQKRFLRVKSSRYEELDQPDADVLAVLRGELMVLSLAAQANSSFRLLPEEDQSLESFQTTMASYGLAFADPEGSLGPDEAEELEPIGDSILPLRLQQMRKPGDTQTITSVTGDEAAAAVVYLQEVVEQRPLTYEEARAADDDMVLTEWRRLQVGQIARDFREGLREASAALPSVTAVTEPLKAAAAEAAEAAIAEAVTAADAGPGAPAVTDELMEQIRADELAAVQLEIDTTIEANEHLVWVAGLAALGDEYEVLEYVDVPRDYRTTLAADERDPESGEQFVKSHFTIFQLDEGSITNVLPLAAAKTTYVVRVAARRFPDMAAMFADPEGMLTSRQIQSGEVLNLMQADFLPAAVMASHDLRIVEAPETEARLIQDEIGDELEDEEPAKL